MSHIKVFSFSVVQGTVCSFVVVPGMLALDSHLLRRLSRVWPLEVLSVVVLAVTMTICQSGA